MLKWRGKQEALADWEALFRNPGTFLNCPESGAEVAA
jgi:hypothetical protein